MQKADILNEFKDCGWIWYDHYGYDDVNVYMLARKSFEIDEVPKKAEIKITADSRYKLYVNGQYVCYGPARGFPGSYPFDRVNIAPHLKKGRNALGVMVHQYGHGTFQSIYAGAAGFLVSGKVGKEDIGTKKNRWLVKKCSGHKQDTIRRSVQLGYQEHFDFRGMESDWLSPKEEIKEGKNGWSYGNYRIVGSAPWFTLEEREIPLLKEQIQNYKKVLFSYYGNAAPDWENKRNLTKIYLEEQNERPDYSKIKSPHNMLLENASFAEVAPFPSKNRITLIIDFGEEIKGRQPSPKTFLSASKFETA